MNFLDINYLNNGNERQQQAYHCLIKHGVMGKLYSFTPILTGTIPINIDIKNSDLDIICYWKEKAEFIDTLSAQFNMEQQFEIQEIEVRQTTAIVCNFRLDSFEIEIFGQNTPSTLQNAYRHMIIEHHILQEKGEDFRQKIIELKHQGIKTEPAFASLLGLKGDPYLSLLNYPLPTQHQ